MKKLIFNLTFLFIATGTVLANDTIVLKNGDVLTGKILEQTADHVYFKSSAFGSVSLSPRDIAEIRVQKEELAEATIPANANNASAPTPAGPNTNEPPKKPKNIKGTNSSPKKGNNPLPKNAPTKEKKWSGKAGLAIAMRQKTSSDLTGVTGEDKYETYRLFGNVDWKGTRNTLRWDWTYRYSRDEDKKRDDFLNVTQKYNHNFENKKLFASAKTLYQRDYNRRIENEYLQTAELGVKWFEKNSRIQLSTSAGGGYHQYDRINSARTLTTSVSQPKFIFDESFSWLVVSSQSLKLTQKYTHLGNSKDYHFTCSFGAENKLINNLFLRVEYRLDRDTEVFYDDRGYFDRALLTNILYKF